ncbi:myeloid leukemia factor isoform X2 [Orussus abietinus]|uniref:myeloid leukemia factor isoform X2 n=1 Tax=Orussus abietinus TaxID=222816 RepID=UPI000626E55F|nr:myeloid leukemia factor isoform X2 [Orussus abietinus]
MSLFGSLVGDFEDDPIFGSHMRSMRHMNTMMNSLFSDPFGMMGPPAITDYCQQNGTSQGDLQMMPFRFPPVPSFNMSRIFTDLNNMAPNDGNCHSFMTSSMMTMTSGPDGRPQVYQVSKSTRTAPGGVKETKKTVCDSRTGTKKMAIGHHIGDRGHILEREQNYHNGDEEERQEFINLDEEEADSFNKEWQTKTRRQIGSLGVTNYSSQNLSNNRGTQDHGRLALPAPVTTTSSSSSKPRASPTAKAEVTATATSGSRKREHTPEPEASTKRHVAPRSDD